MLENIFPLVATLTQGNFEKAILEHGLQVFREEDLFFKSKKDLANLMRVKVTDKNGNSVYRWVKRGEKIADKKPKVDPLFLGLNKQYNLSRLPLGIPKEMVTVNTDGSLGNWVLKWNDPKTNKIVQSYSNKFLEENAAKKWKKIETITTKDIDQIETNCSTLLASTDSDKSQTAAISMIIAKTGLRPGSKLGFTETENRGVSTLAKKNVKIQGDEIIFEFKGKSYKNNTAKIKDKELAAWLSGNIATKEDEDFVFDVDIAKVRTIYQRDITVKNIRLKDMRTFTATEMARQILKSDNSSPPPLPEKNIKKAIQAKLKEVFKKVSEQLNNTPAMAKSSYVHPKVIDQWLVDIGLGDRKTELLKSESDLHFEADYDENLDEYPLPEWWDFNLD